MKIENEKMERLTKGKFKKSNTNSKNNSTMLGTSTLRKTNSIFAPFVEKFTKIKNEN